VDLEMEMEMEIEIEISRRVARSKRCRRSSDGL